MPAVADSIRQKPLHVYFNTPATALAIGRLELPDHLFGTDSPLNSANLISLLDSSAERQKRIDFNRFSGA